MYHPITSSKSDAKLQTETRAPEIVRRQARKPIHAISLRTSFPLNPAATPRPISYMVHPTSMMTKQTPLHKVGRENTRTATAQVAGVKDICSNAKQQTLGLHLATQACSREVKTTTLLSNLGPEGATNKLFDGCKSRKTSAVSKSARTES